MLEPPPVEVLLSAAGLAARDDGLWVDAEELIAAIVTRAGVIIGRLDVRWQGAHWPEPWLRDMVHIPPGHVEKDLRTALREAERAAEAALLECRMCRRRMRSGHMHSDDVCQGCAERHLGVVH